MNREMSKTAAFDELPSAISGECNLLLSTTYLMPCVSPGVNAENNRLSPFDGIPSRFNIASCLASSNRAARFLEVDRLGVKKTFH